MSLFTIRPKDEGENALRYVKASILGPYLWNITYDDIFHIEMAICDNVAAIIVARNVEEAKRKVNQVIIRTKLWLEDKRHATEKTELNYLTGNCIPTEIGITTCGITLTIRKVVNYLGIRLD